MNPTIQKTALITGASSGIGKAIARTFLEKGMIVYGASRQPGRLEKGIRPLLMDVADPAAVEKGVEQIKSETGRLDILVNCAGISLVGAIEHHSPEEADLQMRTNFTGSLNLIRAVLPQMWKQRSGLIINVSSIAGRVALPFQGIYSSSKFALEGLTESLRLELFGSGIHACLIEPGDFSTEIVKNRIFCQASQGENAYADNYQRAYALMEQEELHGPGPERIGQLAWKITRLKNPRLRYTTGKLMQRLAPRVKNLIPDIWFEFILRMNYKIKRPATPSSFLISNP
ncbi:MAG: SDR family oxidoreductase [Bacteroidia bacterium]|nr:SDR family oxidoreductase [Bacteroidia bacterium]